MLRLPHILLAGRWLRTVVAGLIIAALLVAIALLIWVRQSAPAEPAARFALDSDERVLVSRQDWIAFQPRDAEPTTGVVFFPGGKAEPTAYAPILRQLASRGFLVVLIPVPLNLAFLGVEKAGGVMEHFAEIRHWFLAGHSLGGVAAAEFADRHPGQVAGLLLWASYPAATSDLSASEMPVLSVFATADTLATPAKVQAAHALLPPRTRYVAIAGGDHWNYGNFSAGLRGASISRDEQQSRVLDATQAFLEEVAGTRELPAVQ